MIQRIWGNIQIGIVSCAGCLSINPGWGGAVYTANAVYVGLSLIIITSFSVSKERASSHPIQLLLSHHKCPLHLISNHRRGR